MTLNISGAQSNGAVSTEPARDSTTEELLRELTAWSPTERLGALRAWHHDALSLIQLNVITILEAEGPLAMGALADALDVSVASMTGIVTRMEKRGFVERRHGSNDRRVVQVQVTAAGANVFHELEERRRAGLARLLAFLSEDDRRGFLAGLRALRTARQAAAAKVVAADAASTKTTATTRHGRRR